MNQTDIQEIAKGHTELWKAGYKEGLEYGTEQMAWKAIQLYRSMRDKRSVAGNLWHSEEEIEDAIEKAGEKIIAKAQEEPKS